MKLGDTLKKIHNSFDFMGNRIKRLRVDTPNETPDYRQAGYDVQKDFVANKEYVDKVTTYDTTKAYKYKNPFLQWWMKNVQGLPYKELLDDLLFPRLKPIYVDPTVDSCKITIFDSSLISVDNLKNFTDTTKFNGNHTNSKYMVWCNQTLNCLFSIGTTPNDRLSGIAGRISVYDTDGITLLYGFDSDATNDSYSNIKCNFPYKRGYKIIFTKDFNICPTKNDSYNEPSPVDNVNYKLTYDITDQFEKECFVCDSILTLKKASEPVRNTNLSEYVVSNKCIFSDTEIGIFDIAIPEQLNIEEFGLEYFAYSNTKDKSTLVAHEVLSFKQMMESEFVTGTLNGVNYKIFQYNFGCFEQDMEIVLTPKYLKLT